MQRAHSGGQSLFAAVLLAGFVAWAACGRGRDSGATGDEASKGAAGDEAPSGGVVAVTIDGAAFADIPAARFDATDPVPLPHALGGGAPSIDQWQQVEARGDGRMLRVKRKSYPGYQLLLYRDEGGAPSIGLFHRRGSSESARAARSAPVRTLVGVETIAITTVQGAVVAAATEASLDIVRNGKAERLALSKLARARITPWRPNKRNMDGTPAWAVSDLVKLTGPVGTIKRIAVTDGSGRVYSLDGAWLEGRALRIKLSGKDRFNLKHLDAKGATDYRVRDVRRIEIVD